MNFSQMSRVVSTSKLAPDWLHRSEQPIRSRVSNLTQPLIMTQSYKFPLQDNELDDNFMLQAMGEGDIEEGEEEGSEGDWETDDSDCMGGRSDDEFDDEVTYNFFSIICGLNLCQMFLQFWYVIVKSYS